MVILCRLHSQDKEMGTIILCGTLPALGRSHIASRGTWVTHPNLVLSLPYFLLVQPPSSVAGIEIFMGLIKGIGPVYAQRLVVFWL
jgi:hypothetical protein